MSQDISNEGNRDWNETEIDTLKTETLDDESDNYADIEFENENGSKSVTRFYFLADRI